MSQDPTFSIEAGLHKTQTATYCGPAGTVDGRFPGFGPTVPALPCDAVFGHTSAVDAIGFVTHPMVHHAPARVVIDDQDFTARFRKVWRAVGWVAR